jgi:hypothetical protein
VLFAVRRLAVASVVTALVLVASTAGSATALSEGHRTATRAVFTGVLVSRTQADVTTSSTPPSASVLEVSSAFTFLPRKLHVTVVSSTDCSQTDYSFSVVNDTSVTQEVTLNGQKAFRLTTSQEEVVCAPNAGSTIFSLKANVGARLKILSSISPHSAVGTQAR